MTTEEVLAKARREAIRWRILKVLDAGRPMGVSENVLLTVLNDMDLQVTSSELRRELDYLRDRNLVTIKGEDQPFWSADLTRYGVDIVEYTVECHPGIARPPKR